MKPSIWTQSNQGDTTTFHSCAVCGASVQTQDKGTHEKWHERYPAGACMHSKPKGDINGI